MKSNTNHVRHELTGVRMPKLDVSDLEIGPLSEVVWWYDSLLLCVGHYGRVAAWY